MYLKIRISSNLVRAFGVTLIFSFLGGEQQRIFNGVINRSHKKANVCKMKTPDDGEGEYVICKHDDV